MVHVDYGKMISFIVHGIVIMTIEVKVAIGINTIWDALLILIVSLLFLCSHGFGAHHTHALTLYIVFAKSINSLPFYILPYFVPWMHMCVCVMLTHTYVLSIKDDFFLGKWRNVLEMIKGNSMPSTFYSSHLQYEE